MDSILRAAGMYLALMLLFRIAGRRSLSDLTTFDFVLLMIIGEATQQALLGEDFSFINAMLVIATLIVLDVGLSLAKLNSGAWPGAGWPCHAGGRARAFLHGRMRKARLTEDDVLESARDSQGIETVEQIRYAIVERNGKISIIKEQ